MSTLYTTVMTHFAHHFWRSPALPFVESRRARDSSACYAPHTHAALSLGAVDGGMSVFQRVRTRRTLVAGDVVLIPAGEVHSCNPVEDGRWSYQMLYLDPVWLGEVVGEIAESGVRGAVVLNDLPPHLPAAQLHRALTGLNSLLFSALSDEDKEVALVLFAGDVFAAFDEVTVDRSPEQGGGHLAQVRELISERCVESLPLDDLAREAALSRYHFVRAFRARYGMTPHAWQIDQRIVRARRLLDDGMSLVDAALQLGFADQAHFQRAFKERVAVTPGAYRRGRRNFLQD